MYTCILSPGGNTCLLKLNKAFLISSSSLCAGMTTTIVGLNNVCLLNVVSCTADRYVILLVANKINLAFAKPDYIYFAHHFVLFIPRPKFNWYHSSSSNSSYSFNRSNV